MKTINLFFQTVIALFRYVHDVQNGRTDVCQCGYGLHLDRISFFQRLVQDTRRVDYLKYKF